MASVLGCEMGGSACGVWPATKLSRSYMGARLPRTLEMGGGE